MYFYTEGSRLVENFHIIQLNSSATDSGQIRKQYLISCFSTSQPHSQLLFKINLYEQNLLALPFLGLLFVQRNKPLLKTAITVTESFLFKYMEMGHTF